MNEAFRTIREVGIAIDGIYRQLKLITWVVGGCAALALGAAGVLYAKVDGTAVALSRVEGKLDATKDQLNARASRAEGSRDLPRPPSGRE